MPNYMTIQAFIEIILHIIMCNIRNMTNLASCALLNLFSLNDISCQPPWESVQIASALTLAGSWPKFIHQTERT